MWTASLDRRGANPRATLQFRVCQEQLSLNAMDADMDKAAADARRALRIVAESVQVPQSHFYKNATHGKDGAHHAYKVTLYSPLKNDGFTPFKIERETPLRKRHVAGYLYVPHRYSQCCPY
jgi:hypothetical protein